MDLPQKFEIHRILIDGKKVNSVPRLFAAVPKNPKDRKMADFTEAVGFAKCLEIWHQHPLSIYFVNEEISNYKGIDFFLSSDLNKNNNEAFQLLEFKGKYDSVKDTEGLAEWIIKKKFKKGEKRINLVVNVAPGRQLALIPEVMRELLKESPFRSIVLLTAVVNESSTNTPNYALLGLNSFNFEVILSIESESILECSTKCPYFSQKEA